MIVVALCIMTDECEKIIGYDMVVGLGKVDFELIDMLSRCLVHMVDMCV